MEEQSEQLPPLQSVPHPPAINLLELVGQLLWIQLHGGQHVLALSQVEDLDGVGKHGTHLLLFVGGVLAGLMGTGGMLSVGSSIVTQGHPGLPQIIPITQ